MTILITLDFLIFILVIEAIIIFIISKFYLRIFEIFNFYRGILNQENYVIFIICFCVIFVAEFIKLNSVNAFKIAGILSSLTVGLGAMGLSTFIVHSTEDANFLKIVEINLNFLKEEFKKVLKVKVTPDFDSLKITSKLEKRKIFKEYQVISKILFVLFKTFLLLSILFALYAIICNYLLPSIYSSPTIPFNTYKTALSSS